MTFNNGTVTVCYSSSVSEQPDPAARPSLALQIARMQPHVDRVADRLVLEGREVSVRKVREALGRGSLSIVAGALRHWREGLRQRLRGGAAVPGLPAEILEYVRLGYEAARVPAPPTRPPLSPSAQESALRQVLAALEGQVRALRDERAQLLERLGRLEQELSVSRTVAQEFAALPRELQRQLDTANVTIGRLRAELADAHSSRLRTPPRPAAKKKGQRTERREPKRLPTRGATARGQPAGTAGRRPARALRRPAPTRPTPKSRKPTTKPTRGRAPGVRRVHPRKASRR